MMVRRLSAVETQMDWMSAKVPHDQFLLYGFAGVPSDLERALDVIRRRASETPELRLRIEERNVLTYPAWVTAPIETEQFVVHDLADNSWAGCLAAAAGLADHQLDPRRTAWRPHGGSAARTRYCQCPHRHRSALRHCRGGASWRLVHTDSWYTTPMRDWFP